MDKHPSYSTLAPLLDKYPKTSGSLFQAYNDIVYAQQWINVEVIELDKCARGAIKGRKKDADTYMHVVPCTLSESFSIQFLNDAFTTLGKPSEIYLAITSEDASIVYYKISAGIVKPPMAPGPYSTIISKVFSHRLPRISALPESAVQPSDKFVAFHRKHGLCRCKNVKYEVFIGRSPVEDKSLLPKSIVPLHPDELELNSVFKYDTGINNTLYEFHILGVGVAKSDKLPSGKPGLRPVAILQDYISAFNWEINPQAETTPIRDLETGKVWTFPDEPDESGVYYVTLEDYREGDEGQLWEFEEYEA